MNTVALPTRCIQFKPPVRLKLARTGFRVTKSTMTLSLKLAQATAGGPGVCETRNTCESDQYSLFN